MCARRCRASRPEGSPRAWIRARTEAWGLQLGAITLTKLSKRYQETVALRELSLRVEQGEFLTILGPSGSGKTTALALISGLTAPSAGTIRIGERDVTHLAPARRNIGLVFQSYALFPHLSVRENIAFPLLVRKVPDTEAKRRIR